MHYRPSMCQTLQLQTDVDSIELCDILRVIEAREADLVPDRRACVDLIFTIVDDFIPARDPNVVTHHRRDLLSDLQIKLRIL